MYCQMCYWNDGPAQVDKDEIEKGDDKNIYNGGDDGK